jgi:hypothetical protein
MMSGFDIYNSGELGLIALDIQAQNFARLALDDDLKRPAANLAIRREPLRRDAGINGQLERLATKRALDGFGNLHRDLVQNSRDWGKDKQKRGKKFLQEQTKLTKKCNEVGEERTLTGVAHTFLSPVSRTFWLAASKADSCPGRTFENSPRFQPWVARQWSMKSRRDG